MLFRSNALAELKIFPRKFLDEIASSDVFATFNKAVGGILDINPGMRESMLRYMIHVVLSDKRIAEEEVRLLYDFGDSIGFSKMEVASAIADAIQQRFVPSLESIC